MRFLFIPFVLLIQLSFGQQVVQNTENFFVQVMLSDCSEDIYSQIETDLKNNPYVGLIRLDRYSKGLIVGTKNLQDLNKSIFTSWLGENGDKISCYYQGIHGVNKMYAFNEQFCSTINSNQ